MSKAPLFLEEELMDCIYSQLSDSFFESKRNVSTCLVSQQDQLNWVKMHMLKFMTENQWKIKRISSILLKVSARWVMWSSEVQSYAATCPGP